MGVLHCLSALWVDLCPTNLLWTDIAASDFCAQVLLPDADATDAIGAWTYLARETTGQVDEDHGDQFLEDLHLYGDEQEC